jgi:signal transduction histidine kinase
LVQQANVQGKSLPDLPNWPTEIESIEVQEALQRVWRRIGEGNVAGLLTEASYAQDVLNAKIDRVTQLRRTLIQFWWLSVLAVAAYLLFLWRSHRRVVRVLGQVKRLRGFSSMALLSLERYHASLGRYLKVSSSEEEARKRSIIASGINGWRRGRDPANWRPAALKDVIWRAVLLAFDVAKEADAYEKWEETTKSKWQSPRDFLQACGPLRKAEQPDGNSPTYFVSVTGTLDSKVDTPFLFEQALACLVQNAIQAADLECGRKGPRSPISIVATHDRVTVTNSGGPIPEEIRTLINDSTTPEQFETRVLAAVRSAGGARPGIGLTEAYTIATQCYGGLRVGSGAASISLLLRPSELFPLRNGNN